MEDQKVAERLCSIWENIKKMTKYWEALPKSKRQNARVKYSGRGKDELTGKIRIFWLHWQFVAEYLSEVSDRCPDDSISL